MMIQEMVGASLIANEGLIHEAKLRGIRVYVLAVSSEEQARGLFKAGVDGFTINNINMMHRVAGIT